MAHDVFISHAHKDKKIAGAICEKLESARVRCWIAERDISPGEDWTESTRSAIGSSRVMVLVFSENANASPHIEREIAHAFYTKRHIIPVRLTNTLPRRDFLFYLGHVHWFDAFPPAEQQLDTLTTSISDLVNARSVTHNPIPSQNEINTRAPSDLSDSWIGALRASHSRTLEILKRVVISVSILAAVWLVWFIFWQAKPEDNDLRTLKSGSRAGGPSISKPMYTYTRFGLWVPTNTGSSPSVQQTIESDFAKPRPSVAKEAPSEPPRVDQTPPNPPKANPDETADRLLRAAATKYILSGGSPSLDREMRLYAKHVEYYDRGAKSADEIRADLSKLRRRWPLRHYEISHIVRTQYDSKNDVGTVVVHYAFEVSNGAKRKTGEVEAFIVFSSVSKQPRVILVNEHKVPRTGKGQRKTAFDRMKRIAQGAD